LPRLRFVAGMGDRASCVRPPDVCALRGRFLLSPAIVARMLLTRADGSAIRLSFGCQNEPRGGGRCRVERMVGAGRTEDAREWRAALRFGVGRKPHALSTTPSLARHPVPRDLASRRNLRRDAFDSRQPSHPADEGSRWRRRRSEDPHPLARNDLTARMPCRRPGERHGGARHRSADGSESCASIPGRSRTARPS
jgi:hypothetical protein